MFEGAFEFVSASRYVSRHCRHPPRLLAIATYFLTVAMTIVKTIGIRPIVTMAGDPWVPRQRPRGMTAFFILLLPFAFCLLPCRSSSAADIRNELPAPHSLQAVVLNKTITLSWQWQAPEELPVFLEFGYEIKRQDGKTFQVTGTTFADSALFPGTYSYLVRVRGTAKQKGKRVTYVSD